jgi:hypothetical protein
MAWTLFSEYFFFTLVNTSSYSFLRFQLWSKEYQRPYSTIAYHFHHLIKRQLCSCQRAPYLSFLSTRLLFSRLICKHLLLYFFKAIELFTYKHECNWQHFSKTIWLDFHSNELESFSHHILSKHSTFSSDI